MAGHVYPKAFLNMLKRSIEWTASTTNVYYALYSSSYTPLYTDELYGGITGEVSSGGTGYTTGGVQFNGTLTVSAVQGGTWPTTPWYYNFGASYNPSWGPTASFTANWGVAYVNGTVNSIVKPLICYPDFGGAQTVSSNTFTVQVPATGIFQLKAD